MIQTDIRMITNDNFGTNYLHLTAVLVCDLLRWKITCLCVCLCAHLSSFLCICLAAVPTSFIHLSLSFRSPSANVSLFSHRAASEAHLSSWLLWVLPLWPSPYCVSLSHLDYIYIFFIYTYCSTVNFKRFSKDKLKVTHFTSIKLQAARYILQVNNTYKCK